MCGAWIEMLPVRVGQVLIVAVVIMPIVLVMPLLYEPEWTNTVVDTSVAAYHRAETSGLQMATTYSSEYLPVTVYTVPDPTARLLEDYADGYPVDKAHREVLPQGVVVEPLEHSPQHDLWRVVADAPFTMEVLTFAFAGWQAEVDGVSVPVRPSDPHGLITFDVPAGEHTVRVFLGQTPPRTLGVAISILSAISVGALSAADLYRHRLQRVSTPHSGSVYRHYRPSVVVGALMTLVLVIALMREGVMWVVSPPGQALLAQHQVDYNLSDTIRLIGYDLSSRTFKPGDRVELSVYWHASKPPIQHGYSSFVHIANGGPPLVQADKLNPAGRPTKVWSSLGYLYDSYVLTLPDTIPPGEYHLTVGLYTCDTLPEGECGNGDRLELIDSTGSVIADAVPLGTLTVQ
jgi:hypothetical protein